MRTDTIHPAPARRAETSVGRGRRAMRALTGDTPAFLGFVGSLAGVMLMGLVTALVLDVEGEMRVALMVVCGMPFAALTWLIVWVIKNPLD